jgi:hypothetical protein
LGDWVIARLSGLPTIILISHFAALLLFAAVVSAAFAFLTKNTPRERWRYALWSIFLFVGIAIAAGWLMLWFRR